VADPASGPDLSSIGGCERSRKDGMLRSGELDLEAVLGQVEEQLTAFLRGKGHAAVEERLPGEVVEVLGNFLRAGGKRIRPLLCVVGWCAAGGEGGVGPVVRAAASLELFHAFALIHDDLMDNSEIRRGQPTVHRALAARHEGRLDAAQFGASAAMLLGDLALVWSDELLRTAGVSRHQFAAAQGVVDVMRWEVMYGQYLDLLATGRPTTDTARAMKVIRYKSAKYTIERPLHLGASLAGAEPALHAALSEFALPVGEAFQLRDDLLGIFGHPAETGKSRLDDLREGKDTVLITLAMRRADPAQQQLLRTFLGDPELDESNAASIRHVLDATGARTAVEQLIRDRVAQAHQALGRGRFPPAAAGALREIVHAVTVRTR
jgi:geranylgeranyl diphosphate synthase type I